MNESHAHGPVAYSKALNAYVDAAKGVQRDQARLRELLAEAKALDTQVAGRLRSLGLRRGSVSVAASASAIRSTYSIGELNDLVARLRDVSTGQDMFEHALGIYDELASRCRIDKPYPEFIEWRQDVESHKPAISRAILTRAPTAMRESTERMTALLRAFEALDLEGRDRELAELLAKFQTLESWGARVTSLAEFQTWRDTLEANRDTINRSIARPSRASVADANRHIDRLMSGLADLRSTLRSRYHARSLERVDLARICGNLEAEIQRATHRKDKARRRRISQYKPIAIGSGLFSLLIIWYSWAAIASFSGFMITLPTLTAIFTAAVIISLIKFDHMSIESDADGVRGELSVQRHKLAALDAELSQLRQAAVVLEVQLS